jgi:hypothetical protein
MREYGGWIVAVVAAALVVGLLAYARGHEHHHGNDVGATPSYSQGARRTR